MVVECERAPRIAMDTPVLVRRSGEGTWRRATTVNISRTGLLMQTDGLLLDPQTPVDVIVRLPVLGNLAATRILGTGRIVRSTGSPETGSDPMMAAHFDEYRVLPEEEEADYPLSTP